jgi:plastocyanin
VTHATNDRARADETGTRQRSGHADGGPLISERVSIMRRFFFAAGLAASTLCVTACGGNSYGSSSPSSPSDTPPPANAITINVVRENGNQSFSPNPATIPAGQTVVWHNIDTTTHRVVLNDGKLDTGNLVPGAFSQPMTLAAPSPYHCSIHPDMVGALVNQ